MKIRKLFGETMVKFQLEGWRRTISDESRRSRSSSRKRQSWRLTITDESRCVFFRKSRGSLYAAFSFFYPSPAPIRTLLPTFRAGLPVQSAVTQPKSHGLRWVKLTNQTNYHTPIPKTKNEKQKQTVETD